MGHKKQIKFAAIENYNNVLQKPENMKDAWFSFFGNDNPITLELACGKGEYSIGLARQHANRNFLGADIKGNRIFTGAKTALNEGLRNVGFIRTEIDKLENYFHPQTIESIWIIFPDPFLRDSKAKNRLTHPRFLSIYQKILVPGANIHLKTDSRELYDFTLLQIQEQGCTKLDDLQDIYNTGKAVGNLAIQTFYEKMHLKEGRKIYFISFTLPKNKIKLPLKKSMINNEH